MNLNNLKNDEVMGKLRADYYNYNAERGIVNRKFDSIAKDIPNGKLINMYYSHYDRLIDEHLSFLNAANVDVITHTDMDGDASGSMMYQMAKTVKSAKVNVFRYNYKKAELYRHINEARSYTGGKTALITDLSLPIEDIQLVVDTYDEVVWVDHHATSFKVAKELLENEKNKKKVTIVLDKSISATYLTYLLFCGRMGILPNVAINNAYAALLVSEYDTWNDKETIRFMLGTYFNQYYFSIGTLTCDHDHWSNIFFNIHRNDNELLETLVNGKKLFNLEMLKNDILYDSIARYNFSYNGFTMSMINGHGNSNRWPECTVHDIQVIMKVTVYGEMTVSIFSKNEQIQKLDLGRICREHFNGGGHPGAAGFNMNISDFNKYIDSHKDIPSYLHCPTITGSFVNRNKKIEEITSRLAAVLKYEISIANVENM